MRNLLFFTIAIAFFSCQNSDEQQSTKISMLNAPSSGHAEVPRLTTSDKGEVYMSWIKQEGESSKLKYAKLNGSSWGTPILISRGDNWFVNWADFPSLIVGEDYMAAHWLQKRDAGTYDYDVRISTSKDGSNWTDSFIPHKDGISAEHGFVSMLPMENGQFFATWLDGRNTKSNGHDHADMEHAGAMTLRAGIFDLDGSTIKEWELDDRTCDCCQTAAAIVNGAPTVVYRDRSENEVRDIFSTSLKEDVWTSPSPVGMDLWKIAGCPVNGPALTFNGEQHAVAWYTAAGNTPKVKLALSDSKKSGFQAPIIVAEGETLGRVGITSLSDGTFVVSWLMNNAESTGIMLSQYGKRGELLNQLTLAETSPGRASGFPVITSKGKEVIAAWTIEDEPSRIETAIIEFN